MAAVVTRVPCSEVTAACSWVARQEGMFMNIAELETESAELVPDRKALGCWYYGWHGWQGYGYGGYSDVSLNLSLSLNISGQSGGWGW